MYFYAITNKLDKILNFMEKKLLIKTPVKMRLRMEVQSLSMNFKNQI